MFLDYKFLDLLLRFKKEGCKYSQYKQRLYAEKD